MKKFIIASIIATAAVFTAVSATSANDNTSEQSQKQKLEQEMEWRCDHGSYGEITSCYFKGRQVGEQEQRQRVLAAQVGGRRIHIPADTAIDTQTAALIMAAAFMGLGASLTLNKLK